MTYYLFLFANLLLVSAYVYAINCAGAGLAIKALLTTFGLWLSISLAWFPFREIVSQTSIRYVMFVVPVFVLFEDIVRTWFVTSQSSGVKNKRLAALAFAGAASAIELWVQTFALLDFAFSKVLEYIPHDSHQNLESYFGPTWAYLYVIGINAFRMLLHYWLGIALCNAWLTFNRTVFCAIIGSHIILDIAIEIATREYQENSVALVFVLFVAYTLCLGLLVRWQFGCEEGKVRTHFHSVVSDREEPVGAHRPEFGNENDAC